ncbi:MAG: ApaG domain [Chloroherpetonaceae bacterium]|nr:ApaG domain [Chloroherpetonaceae bacterium]MDW8438537.1 ApaG domain [Chloroherpetonaceae bacterium]
MTDICYVTLDSLVEIAPQHIEPPYKYGYAYTISIHNPSPYTVQIHSRRWVIRDGDMKDRIVEGAGVVGEFPIIPSGEKFTYRSYMVLRSRYGSAFGSYFGTFTYESEPEGYFNEQNVFLIHGEPFEVPIPEFQMIHRDE